MENIVIRKAILEDVSYIQNLNNELFKLEKENYDTTLVLNWALTEEGKDYFEDLIKNQYVIVATLEDKIIGYLAGSINEKGSYEEIQYGEINNMFIKEDYRLYGIGKKLINNFFKEKFYFELRLKLQYSVYSRGSVETELKKLRF